MSEEVVATIEKQIQENPVLLYMKGSPQAPQCGFGADRAVYGFLWTKIRLCRYFEQP